MLHALTNKNLLGWVVCSDRANNLKPSMIHWLWTIHFGLKFWWFMKDPRSMNGNQLEFLGVKLANLWLGTQDFCLDFVSINDARWRTQKKHFSNFFLDFVSLNDARWRTQFLDFVSEICQYGLRVRIGNHFIY